ncbi:MAG: acetyltransferase [Clostridiales bacterium]|nr:acetyltransferase [Clostridiales bacterium]
MNRLVIVGASGHGKVVADIACLVGYEEIVFLDNNPELKDCLGYPVIGSNEILKDIDGDVFIAVGNSEVRKRLMSLYENRNFPVLIHPSAVIAKSVQIDAGSIVMAGAVINPEAKIGKGVIINTSCSIDHECTINDFCHVSVGSHLAGNVIVGEASWIGAGAIVSNNVSISSGCIIGAGTVVVHDIETKGTYIGVPARKIK